MNTNAYIIDKIDIYDINSDDTLTHIKKEYICNICTENIVDDTIIGLKCDPEKHIFCYTCIFDWYMTLKKKHSNYGNYDILTMCPICRQNGGKLPVCNNETPIYGLHITSNKKSSSYVKGILCGTPLKGNPYKTCCSRGQPKFNGKCGVHKNTQSISESVVGTSVINSESNILESSTYTNSITNSNTPTLNLCNAPLKTKIGKLCKAKGNPLFNGKCGLHKDIISNDALIYPIDEINVI